MKTLSDQEYLLDPEFKISILGHLNMLICRQPDKKKCLYILVIKDKVLDFIFDQGTTMEEFGDHIGISIYLDNMKTKKSLYHQRNSSLEPVSIHIDYETGEIIWDQRCRYPTITFDLLMTRSDMNKIISKDDHILVDPNCGCVPIGEDGSYEHEKTVPAKKFEVYKKHDSEGINHFDLIDSLVVAGLSKSHICNHIFYEGIYKKKDGIYGMIFGS